MTLIAIDPDVFAAAFGDENCDRALEWVYDNSKAIEIALDKKKVLYYEYVDFLDAHRDQYLHPAVRLVLDLINSSFPQIHQLSANCSHNDENLIRSRGCQTPVESVLIGMAINAPKTTGLTLLLVSPPGLHKRCLHDQKVKEEFSKLIDKLSVIYADGTKITFPALEELPPKSERGLWFEDKAAHIVRELYGCPHLFLRTPKEVKDKVYDKGKTVGDVDIWGYERAGNPRQVWVGECKLREFNEENWITDKEVKQLKVKLDAVRNYEEARTDVSSGPIEIKGFMVSNATNMTPEAWKLANEIGATFLRTSFSHEWQNPAKWEIVEVEEFEPIEQESSPRASDHAWRGLSIRHLRVLPNGFEEI